MLCDAQLNVTPKLLKTYTFKCSRGGNDKSLWLASAVRIKRVDMDDKRKALKKFNLTTHRTRYDDNINEYDLHKQLNDKNRSNPAKNVSQVFEKLNSSELEQISGNSNQKEYRVMPHHLYPHRWMTLDELQKEMLRSSSHFHDLRRPFDEKIGSLQVEVLSCHGLPKLDKFTKKIDPFVCLVLGSTVFKTDIIYNVNQPCWLRLAKRACIFPVSNAHSQLYVGVFDYDGENETDDFAGRVVIDICKLRPRTLYDITLPLRESSHGNVIFINSVVIPLFHY